MSGINTGTYDIHGILHEIKKPFESCQEQIDIKVESIKHDLKVLQNILKQNFEKSIETSIITNEFEILLNKTDFILDVEKQIHDKLSNFKFFKSKFKLNKSIIGNLNIENNGNKDKGNQFYLTIDCLNRIALTLFDYNIYIYILNNFKRIACLRGHSELIKCFEILPNNRLATGSHDKTIKIWDLNKFTCLSTLKKHSDWISCIRVISNDFLVSGSHDKTIVIWDISRFATFSEGENIIIVWDVLLNENLNRLGEKDYHIAYRPLKGHAQRINSLTGLPNNMLLSGSSDKTYKVWCLNTFTCLQTIDSVSSERNCSLSLPANRVVTYGDGQLIRIWSVSETGLDLIKELIEVYEGALDVAYVSNNRLVSCTNEFFILIWNLDDFTCIKKLTESKSFEPNNLITLSRNRLISVNDRNKMQIWDLNKFQCIKSIDNLRGAFALFY